MNYRPLYGPLLLIVAVAFNLTGCSFFRPTQATPGAPLPIPAIPETVSATIDGTRQFQTIDGFGVNLNGTYWNNGAMAPALDALYDDLGSTIFRVMVETSYWERTNDNADPYTFDWDAYRAIYAGPEFQSLFGIIRHLTQKQDAQVILNVMGPVPAWMGAGRIDASAEDEWVELITSLLIYTTQDEGLPIQLLAPVNEIDLGDPEGPKMEPDQYVRLLRKLAERLDALGLDEVRFVVPDLAFSKNAQQFLPAILADDVVMAKLAHFAIHDYSGELADINRLIGSERAATYGLWVTEYSQWCVDCNKLATTADSWVFGADTTSFLLRYLAHGATAALLYDGVDGYYVHHGTFDYWGVLSYDPETGAFAPRPRFNASAQIFRFVRPGMVRIAAETSSEGLMLLAFRDPSSGALSLVGRNPTDHPVTINGVLAGLELVQPLMLTQTTPTASLMSGRAIPVQTGSFSVEIAPDSVFALSTLQP